MKKETNMPSVCEAYLDIETTGLSPSGSEITIIGIHICKGDEESAGSPERRTGHPHL